MSNFHPLEVVGRGSETQIQVGENHLRGNWLKIRNRFRVFDEYNDQQDYISPGAPAPN